MLKLSLLLFGLAFAVDAMAAGSIIVAAVMGASWVAANAVMATVIAFAINMVVSTVISKALFTPSQPDGGLAGSSPDPGNRQQIPPATDNKVPIVYGSAWVGGTIVDLSISQDNQDIYYVMALSEVTNTNEGQTPDTITFGDVYYGGKKVVFKSSPESYVAIGDVEGFSGASVTLSSLSENPASGSKITFANSGTPTQYTVQSVSGNTIFFTTSVTGLSAGTHCYQYAFDSNYATKVTGLLDESTGVVDTKYAGKIEIFLYSNGSNAPYNTTQNAVSVMSTSDLIYQWDSSKLMSNCAFAIVHLTYNADAGIRGIEQTKFQVINSRHKPGDCFRDYMINQRYGAALPEIQINTTSLDELNAYCDQSFTFTTYEGTTSTQTRFRFDGTIDPSRSIMQNLQDMATCCDCLLKYNEITAKWGVIVQKPTYSVAMNINDSNIVSAIQITPVDLNNSFNVVEVKFPDENYQDAFNSATFDLAQIDPALLYPNEPVNKQSLALPLVNNDVRAQYLATRFIKSAREDLQIDCSIGFTGIQLEAGDILTITNANYGWVAKPVRINKVTETFNDDGSIVCRLLLMEFNPEVYDDANVTQFSPAPNSGLADPTIFGVVPAPTITAQYPTNANPLFVVTPTCSSAGIVQYAEVWYSAYSSPTSASQLIFAGTTAVLSSGQGYAPSQPMSGVSLANIPAGNWYFFSRMVNSLASSDFSPASAVLQWRPSTYQYTARYLSVAFADSITGTGFTLNPRNKSYYGLCNQTGSTPSSNPADYTWYLAEPTFGTTVYLLYANRTGRKFSFDSGFAVYAAGTGSFVPSQALLFDPSIWSALPDGTNIIDLDHRTGQLIETGTTTIGSGEIAVANSSDGKIVAQLKPYLDFGTGVATKTSSVALLTVDIYGRVVGFEPPDDFNMTISSFVATSGQTVFSVSRAAGYITGQCLVFENGILQSASDYTDSASAVTFSTGRAAGDGITIISFRSVNSTTGVYATFTRNDVALTNASSYTASGFTLNSGYEFLFANGSNMTEQDYDIIGQDITNFPSTLTGDLTIIQWAQNNLTTPAGDVINNLINAVLGQTNYSCSYNPLSFNLYYNGVLLLSGTDYLTGSGSYTLLQTPTTVDDVMVQQNFARTGAA